MLVAASKRGPNLIAAGHRTGLADSAPETGRLSRSRISTPADAAAPSRISEARTATAPANARRGSAVAVRVAAEGRRRRLEVRDVQGRALLGLPEEVRYDVASEALDLVRHGIDRPEHERVEAVVDEAGERLDPPVGRPRERFAGQIPDRKL
jgi:hypothetical protein